MALGAVDISVPRTTSDSTQHTGKKQLSEDDKKQVTELKKRDQDVKAHEAAHIATGGSYIRGGASYSYQTGPDGRRYAVGGEVSIDTSPVRGDPQATIQKMQIVKRAALAPANPSGQDRAVAAAAASAEAAAQQEKIAQQKAEQPVTNSPEEVNEEKNNDEHSSKAASPTDHSRSYNPSGVSTLSTSESPILNLLA